MTDLASIAVQIQDRALLLASERGLVDLATLERDQAQTALRHEIKQNSLVRKSLLQIVRSRHGFELELTRMREQLEEVHERNETLQRQEARWKEQADEMEAAWKLSVHELYAQHEAKRRLYQQFLERRIESRLRQTKLKQDRLEFLERRASEMQADEKQLLEQTRLVEAETKLTDSQEEPEDEEVSSLAMQIKATLSKVGYVHRKNHDCDYPFLTLLLCCTCTQKTSLRQASQTAKEAYRQANDEMIKWETECMQQRA